MKSSIVLFAVLIGLTSGFSTEKIPTGRALRNELHEQLNELQTEVTNATARYKSRHLTYYTGRLDLVLDSIHNYVEQLAEQHDAGWELTFRHQLVAIAKQIRYEIANPAPEEAFKAGVIYVSAIISLRNETSAPDFVHQIHKKLKNIIFREEHNIGRTFKDKLLKINTDEELVKMRQELRDMLVNYTIPAVDSHEYLEEQVGHKINLLKENGQKEEADKWEKEFGVYQKLTFTMNDMMPIYNEDNLEKWFDNSQTHHTMSEKFEKFVAEKLK